MFKQYDEYLYRYEDATYSGGFDEYGDYIPGSSILKVELREYGIIKRTPKGAWIDYYGDKKFVLLTARKKFACNTIEEAKESFVARKNRQLQILEAQLNKCKSALRIIDKEKGDYDSSEIEI